MIVMLILSWILYGKNSRNATVVDIVVGIVVLSLKKFILQG